MRIVKPIERWFPCPDDPDNGKILIRQLSPGERQEIFDDTMPTKTEYEEVVGDDGKPTGDLIPKFSMEQDRAQDRELTLKMCVVDWENFFEENGDPLECTHENIIRASKEIIGFSEFVIKCRTQLDKDVSADKEEQEKNL